LKVFVYSGNIPSTTFVERLEHGLAKEGVSVYLHGYLSVKPAPLSNIKVIGYRGKISKVRLSLSYFFRFLTRLTDLKKLLRLVMPLAGFQNKLNTWVKYAPVVWHQPDVFHLQWVSNIKFWLPMQDFGIKVVCSLRGRLVNALPLVDKELAQTYQECFPKVDGFHGVSKAICHRAAHYGADMKKCSVVYSGMPLANFQWRGEEHTGQIKKEPGFKIISVGRDNWQKGYMHALDAMALLKKSGFDFHYTIVGGSGSEELTFQLAQLGLEKEVSLISRLPFDQVLQEMAEADVVLLSSVAEGIANVVLEAMAIGTIVVTTDCGGMKEVIQNRVNGFILPVSRPDLMAKTLQEVKQLSSEERSDILKKAFNTVSHQHNEDRMVSDMIALYQKVLAA